MDIAKETARIRELNDAFRTTFLGGAVEISPEVEKLPQELRARIVTRVRDYNLFQNDEADEHDAGSFIIDGIRYSWIIYCYNADMTGGSEDPSDSEQTTRVLSIQTMEEYLKPPI